MAAWLATSAHAQGANGVDFVSHYYRSILHRDATTAERETWTRNVERMRRQGMRLDDAWFGVAETLFAGREYADRKVDDATYVAEMYAAFLDTPPDDETLKDRTAELANGATRIDLRTELMFSDASLHRMRRVYGDFVTRAEVDFVADLYRGLLARLPDEAGLEHWVSLLREAQCRGIRVVRGAANEISRRFIAGSEYAGRGRSSREYVADLRSAFGRGRNDTARDRQWASQLDTGLVTREEVRAALFEGEAMRQRLDAIARQCATASSLW